MSKLADCIDKIIIALIEAKQALQELEAPTAPQPQPPVPTPAPKPSPPPNGSGPVLQAQSTPKNDLDPLKEILFTDQWPEATSRHLICDPDNEQEKLERGRGVLELMIEEELKGLNFLDVGCGEGQTAFVAAEFNAATSVGYDRKKFNTWDDYKRDNLTLTTSWDEVVSKGPYNVILLFDVLDHLVGEEPTPFLKKIHDVLTPNGKLYMRTHPLTSRHACHTYHDLNKAYVHLVFKPDELKAISPQIASSRHIEPCLPIVYPLKTYKEIIENAGFKISDVREMKESVEPFFKTPAIAQRITKNLGLDKFPDFQMSLQFVDYVLTKVS